MDPLSELSISVHKVDLAILIVYLIGIVLAGVYLTRLASRNIDSYFLGGRSLPWWLLGMSMVGVLSGNQPIKGIIGAGIGLMLGAIGDAPAIAEYRYTFGFDYLMDGISLVIVGLGLFAFPEIIDLLIREL